MGRRLLQCLLVTIVLSAVMSQDVTQCMMNFANCQRVGQHAMPQGPHSTDPCAPGAQLPMDPCAIYNQIVKCVSVNMSSCMSIPQLAEVVKNLTVAKDQVCSPEVVCQQKVSLCGCRLKPSDGSSPDAQALCTGYHAYEECMSEDEECASIPMVKQALDTLRGTYGAMCSKESQPMCQERMKCLSQAMPSNQGGNPPRGGDVPTFSAVCRSAETMFDCLGDINHPECVPDEREVTFEDLKESYAEVCENVLPHIERNVHCKALDQCDQTFMAQNVSSLVALLSNIGRADFWCSYLFHYIKCLSSSADACSFSDEAKKIIMAHQKNMPSTCRKEDSSGAPISKGISSITAALVATSLCGWNRV